MDHRLSLVEKAKEGDARATEQLVEENSGLVYSVARRFLNRGYELEDLYQIGCIGLLKCISHFDLSYQVQFSTYAVPMIMGEIKRFLRDDGMIKVSRSLKENAYKIRKKQEEWKNLKGEEPTIDEIAVALELTQEEIVAALSLNVTVDSIHKPVYSQDGDEVALEDKLMDQKMETEQLVTKLAVEELINKLPAMEQDLIRLRYFQELTLHQFIDDMDDREIFTTLKVLEIIQKEFHNAEVENIGCSEFIVYYKRPGVHKKSSTYIKIVLVSLVCFFGAGFTMITYDTDTGVKDVLGNLQQFYSGKVADGPSMLEIGYALGIIIGVLIFFNHTARKRLSDEPTPLEVKMRLYEKDVNDTLITGGGRKGETIDVD